MGTVGTMVCQKLLLEVLEQTPKPCHLLAAGSSQEVSSELIAACAAYAPYRIAADSGAQLLYKSGISPDVVVGDMDSIASELLDEYRAAGVAILAVSADKDQTDLQLALKLAVEAGALSVAIGGALSGRLDHELAVLGACAEVSDQVAIILFSDDTLVWIQGPGGAIEVGRYLKIGQTFSVLALGDNAVVSESGTAWELQETPLKTLDPRGVSNLVRSTDARVAVISGVVAVVVPCQA